MGQSAGDSQAPQLLVPIHCSKASSVCASFNSFLCPGPYIVGFLCLYIVRQLLVSEHRSTASHVRVSTASGPVLKLVTSRFL